MLHSYIIYSIKQVKHNFKKFPVILLRWQNSALVNSQDRSAHVHSECFLAPCCLCSSKNYLVPQYTWQPRCHPRGCIERILKEIKPIVPWSKNLHGDTSSFREATVLLSRKCSYLLNWISWLKTTYTSLWQKWKVNFLIGQLFHYLKIALPSHIGEYVAILIHV